jgi:hypothetical protein
VSDPAAIAARLAAAIADAATAVMAGQPDRVDADGLRRLIAQLGAERSAAALPALVAALGPALAARGVPRAKLDALPPSVVAFLDAADAAFLDAADGDDLDAAAERLERAASPILGTSTRRGREEALREQIRREVSESLTRTLRARGLTPAADLPPDDRDDDEEAR